MSAAPSPAGELPSAAAAPTWPEMEQLMLAKSVLQSQNDELLGYVEALNNERAMLSARITRLELWIEKTGHEAGELLGPRLVLRQYAPGILHAVPAEMAEPAAPAGGLKVRRAIKPSSLEVLLATMRKLPPPTDRILHEIAMRDPSKAHPVQFVADEVKLSVTGGHFKKGLKTLLREKLIVVDKKPEGDLVRLAAGFWNRGA